MKGYGQFCPVAKAAEVFAQRWTPLIVRELCFGPKRFSELHAGVPLMSRALLVRRLEELEDAGVVVTEPLGQGKLYGLSPAGEELRQVIEMMSSWGQRWGQGRLGTDDFDPTMLIWSIKRQIDPETLPPDELVVRIEFRGLTKAQAARRYWWLIFRPDDIEVCFKAPEKEAQAVISADLEAFTRAWMGYVGTADAVSEGAVSFSGDPRAIARVKVLLGMTDGARQRPLRFAAA